MVVHLIVALAASMVSGGLRSVVTPRFSALRACSSLDDMQLQLQMAVRIEDYARAAQLKKQIDASAAKEGAKAEQAATSAAVSLVEQFGETIDSTLAAAGENIVVLFFSSTEHGIANSLVQRAASEFAASQLAGGPACAFLKVSEAGVERIGAAMSMRDPSQRTTLSPPSSSPRPAVAEAVKELCRSRDIRSLPTTQIWRNGRMVQELSTAQLGSQLLAVGARSTIGRSFAKGTESRWDRNAGSGRPDGNAVDDIDFTGGIAGAGGTQLNKWRDAGRTTSKYTDFGDSLVDKPGDNMGKEGPPQSPKPKDGY